MGDMSDFHGLMQFDFTKTNLNSDEIEETIEYICDYFDGMNFYIQAFLDEVEPEEYENKKVIVDFNGRGINSFEYNIKLFTEKEFLNNIFPKCCGLEITFDYCNAEREANFIIRTAKINIKYGLDKAVVTKLDDGILYPYTEENMEKYYYNA